MINKEFKVSKLSILNRISIAELPNAIVLEGPRIKTEVREMEKRLS